MLKFKGWKKERALFPASFSGSKIANWEASGGRLSWSFRRRVRHAASQPEMNLFPYIDAGVASPLRSGAIMTFLVGMVFVAGYIFYFASLRGSEVQTVARSGDFTVTPTLASYEQVIKYRDSEPVVSDKLPLLILEGTLYPTLEPTLTPTLVPTATPTPLPSPTPICAGCSSQSISVRLGFFYPPLGGSHCPTSEPCENERLADGKDWFSRLGMVAACPEQFYRARLEVSGVGVFDCVHKLPLARCDWSLGVCDVLVLFPESVVPDWRTVYPAVVWFK